MISRRGFFGVLAAATMAACADGVATFEVSTKESVPWQIIRTESKSVFSEHGFPSVCCSGTLNGYSDRVCFDPATHRVVATSTSAVIECHAARDDRDVEVVRVR